MSTAHCRVLQEVRPQKIVTDPFCISLLPTVQDTIENATPMQTNQCLNFFRPLTEILFSGKTTHHSPEI
jgi:hypothetical protein